jgi:osmotically-inducible protein OsmY
MRKLNLIVRFLLGLLLILSVTGCAGSKVSESTGEYFDDSMVTSKIKTAFLTNSRLKMMDITVETFKGAVQLSGFVDSTSIAETAVQVARSVKGVKVVNNSLVVK